MCLCLGSLKNKMCLRHILLAVFQKGNPQSAPYSRRWREYAIKSLTCVRRPGILCSLGVLQLWWKICEISFFLNSRTNITVKALNGKHILKWDLQRLPSLGLFFTEQRWKDEKNGFKTWNVIFTRWIRKCMKPWPSPSL